MRLWVALLILGSVAHADPVSLDVGASTLIGKGGLTPAQLDRVIATSRGLYRVCYQRELNRVPQLSGVLVSQLSITADGSVRNARPESTSLPAGVPECVASRLVHLHFPRAKAATRMRVSMRFYQAVEDPRCVHARETFLAWQRARVADALGPSPDPEKQQAAEQELAIWSGGFVAACQKLGAQLDEGCFSARSDEPACREMMDALMAGVGFR